jgi:23S rRNA (adenine2503-C2)-methyltransferase
MPNIYDLDLDVLETMLVEWGQPPYRASQVWEGLYCHFWSEASQFNTLPKKLRQQLSDTFTSPPATGFSHLQPLQTLKSSDHQTIKTLFQLHDGHAIEAVLMRYNRRRTLCISSQAGCGMGCVFCATGQMGFRRHLSSGEIVEQVLYYARLLATQGEKVTNVVVMGMGEPFHNYEATLAAIDRLNDPQGFDFGARRFTISTVGLVPMIQRFTAEQRQVNLAVSLHAADDVLRSELLPINKKYPLEVLLAACLEYVETTRRRISFEWALIQDVNDSPEQAGLVAERLQPFRRGAATLCHVNVIPLNPTNMYTGQATTRKRAEIFKSILEEKGIPCTIRLRRGVDIQAGCGQLAEQQLAR